MTPGKEDTTTDKQRLATASSSSGISGRCSADATCVPADKRLRDLVRLRLLTRRTQGNTKAAAVYSVHDHGRVEPITSRRPTMPGVV